ncbi:protein kinase [bacterium]|nr:protein kinase [bacterium]
MEEEDRNQPSRPSIEENEALQPFDINALVGKKLEDRYQIMDIVGQGGMAVVYRGRRLVDGAAVAIKTLKFAEAALMKRFMREVQIHIQLKHPNIVEPIEFFTTGEGRTFFVMELLRGRSVEDLFLTRGRFHRPADLKEIIAAVCDALAFAHNLGIVHRDVKPANIIVSIQDGGKIVDVVDFGLAKLHEDLQRITKTGQVLGSPVYMSPEQCRGDSLDPRSDIYSLAVVMYEMVTGELPFDASNPVAMMESHCNPELIPIPIYRRDPDFPGGRELNSIVRKSMETDPSLRYQTIDQFKEAFMNWYQLVATGADAGGFFQSADYAAYMKEPEPSVPEPSLTPGAFSLSSRAQELESASQSDRSINDSKPVEIREVPLASSGLRGALDEKLTGQGQIRSFPSHGGYSDFVSEATPRESKAADLIMKVVLFVVVVAAFTGGTIYLCIKFMSQ